MATRLLTINIRKYLSGQPRRKRPVRLPRYIRYRIARSTNIGAANIKIDKGLNALILKRYLYDMHPITVSINVDKGIATVTHFDKNAKKEEKKAQQPAAKTAAQPAPQQKAGKGAETVQKKPSEKPKEAKARKPSIETKESGSKSAKSDVAEAKGADTGKKNDA